MAVWTCQGCGSERRTLPVGWARYEPRKRRGDALAGICGRCEDLRPQLVRDWDQTAALDKQAAAAGLGGGDPGATG
jgi:hypothetical protein